MLSRLPTKVLWNINHHLHKPQQFLTMTCTRYIASSPTLNSKELEESKDTSNNRQVSTSFAEKAKSNAKTGGYGLVIIAGLGVIGTVVATILKELFSSNSANSLYDKAVQDCISDNRVQDKLGEPVKAFGEESRRGRRNRVSQMKYQDNLGRKGIRIQFYLQGVRNRATVELDAREDSSGYMKTRYLIVNVEDMLRTTIIVEDNRSQLS